MRHFFVSCNSENMKWVAVQIEEAEREAYDKAQKEHGDKWTEVALKARAEGFRAARDKAKGIAHTHDLCIQNTTYNCATDIAQRIASMEVEK